MLGEIQLFSTWLGEHRRGELDAEITASLAEVVQQVQRVGNPKKAGEITITVRVTTSGHESPTVLLVDEVGVKVPQFGRPATTYYVDVTGGLSRNDPMQPAIPGTEAR